MSPPDFSRSVNTTSTGWAWGQIMTIIITCPPPGFSDLPTVLYMLGGCSLYSQTAQQIHIQILGCQA